MKDYTDYRVNRTRPIPLNEADQNENSKRVARDAMVSAEMYYLLANELYISRLYRSIIYLITNTRLIYDISQQMKRSMTVCSNDTLLCYDNKNYVTALLTLRQLSIPKPMIISMLHTIQMIEHSIRISFGDLTETYGGTQCSLPPHGIIQGNGTSPMIWAAISNVLFLVI